MGTTTDCPHCGRSFDTARALNGHLARKHGGAAAFAAPAPAPEAAELGAAREALAKAKRERDEARAVILAAFGALGAFDTDPARSLPDAIAEALAGAGAMGTLDDAKDRDETREALAAVTRERDEARAELATATAAALSATPNGDGALRLAIALAERDEARAALARIGDAWAALQVAPAPRQRPASAPREAATVEGAPAPGKRLQRCVACGQCVNARRGERCPECEAADRPRATAEQWAQWTDRARRNK